MADYRDTPQRTLDDDIEDIGVVVSALRAVDDLVKKFNAGYKPYGYDSPSRALQAAERVETTLKAMKQYGKKR